MSVPIKEGKSRQGTGHMVPASHHQKTKKGSHTFVQDGFYPEEQNSCNSSPPLETQVEVAGKYRILPREGSQPRLGTIAAQATKPKAYVPGEGKGLPWAFG